MLDVIVCANFGVEKLSGLGNTRGQILEFPIEMAGHLYNRAGATAQPVIHHVPKLAATPASNMPNTVCSSWISMKIVHCTLLTSCVARCNVITLSLHSIHCY